MRFKLQLLRKQLFRKQLGFAIHVCLLSLSITAICSANEVAGASHTRHLSKSNTPLFTNKLVGEQSLYLQQHAHNPVNWQPWGEAAFADAVKQNKPVLLSIGYSTCHWCHVMARESFEDLDVAEYINQHFIAIKVDREEQPHVDEVYLTAVQMLSGKAGWPLTAVLTPQGLPFFGGTYFPKGQFLTLLNKINATWQNNHSAVLEQANRIQGAMQALNQSASTGQKINNVYLASAIERVREGLLIEPNNGGSTFPREPEMLLLLHDTLLQPNSDSLQPVLDRLTTLARSGLHDQLAGGFHRYSVDPDWLVPHFEKMLYNQAQLGQLYATAFLLSNEPFMRATAEATFDFVLTDMQSAKGGFYAAMDAESDGREGAYYLWEYRQLAELLSDSELQLARSAFGISPAGNFAGENVLQLIPSTTANKPQIAALQQKLLAARVKRNHPVTDRKIITAWNAMMISALIKGHQATAKVNYLDAALSAAKHIWKDSWHAKHGLSRTLIDGSNGRSEARVAASLTDYAYFSNALLDLADATQDQQWLARAEQISAAMLIGFDTPDGGAFKLSAAENDSSLLAGFVSARDDAINSGNSMAAQVLARLYRRTGKVDYRNRARKVLSTFASQMTANPGSLSGMLLAAHLLNNDEAGSRNYAALGKVRIDSKLAHGKLLVKITIDAGWHINAYRVIQDNLIATALMPTTSHCPTIGQVTYPDGKLVSLGFQDDALLVYENTVELLADIEWPESATCNLLAGELKIQACSDEVCMLPETLALRVSPHK